MFQLRLTKFCYRLDEAATNCDLKAAFFFSPSVIPGLFPSALAPHVNVGNWVIGDEIALLQSSDSSNFQLLICHFALHRIASITIPDFHHIRVNRVGTHARLVVQLLGRPAKCCLPTRDAKVQKFCQHHSSAVDF